MDDIELVVNVPEGMTREEIKKTPELVDFMLDECVTAVTRMKLHKRLEELCKLAIEALEQTRWIPVSERLPDINDEVLVTYIVNGNTKKRYVETASYYAGLDEWTSYYDEYRVAGTKVEIVAWMPLPQPYKAESEDEE